MTVSDPEGLAVGAGSSGGASVLLVEDEESIAQPFAQALARNGFRPLLARTAAEAVRIGREAAPDIILLDLTLPDGDGRDVCRELRRSSDVPIIMLTARGTVTDRVVGLELGADDYIVKPFSTGEVIARIRAVLRRGRTGEPAAPEEIVVRDLRIDLAARRAWLGGRELGLTRKELDLLARLARDAGRVVTRETLMSEVWDENWFGSTKTLDVHLAGLRRKLGDDPAAARWIHTVRGVGFRFAADDEPGAGGPAQAARGEPGPGGPEQAAPGEPGPGGAPPAQRGEPAPAGTSPTRTGRPRSSAAKRRSEP